MVSITTEATWHTRTSNFWTDFEWRHGNKRVANWVWVCVKAERLHLEHLL